MCFGMHSAGRSLSMNHDLNPLILVVDDEPAVRYSTIRILEKAGFRIIQAASGHEALELVSNEVDVVLLDVNLPDMNGFEVCRKIKADPATASVSVVHLSARFTSTLNRIEGMEGGADGYLTHPVSSGELVATIRSFARLRRAERRIEVEVARWQTTFDSINDGIVLVSLEGIIERTNNSFRKTFSDVTGGKFNTLCRGLRCLCDEHEIILPELDGSAGQEADPDQDEELSCPLCIAKKTSRRACVNLSCGSRRFEITVDPVFDDSGEVVRFVATFNDMTDRFAQEEKIARNEARLRKVLETIPVGVWILDASGSIILGNREGQKIWGGSRYVGMENYGVYEAWYLGTGEKVQADEWAAAKTIRSHAVVMNEELRILGFDGQYRAILNSAVPILSEDGTLEGAVVVNQDISDRIKAEERIKVLNEELEARVRMRTAQLEAINEDLESFSYSVSHDLRSPLRAINGFAHALSDGYRKVLTESGAHYLDRILESSAKMGRLIDDLLSLSRIGRTGFQRETADLSQLALSIFSDLKTRDPGRSVDIRVASGMIVQASTHFLEIMMRNLIENSWKYTSLKEHACITVGFESRPENTVFFISDDGAGFDMASAGKLFTPFWRMHSAKEFPGTGIGLALVHRIVSRHDGRIWAESEPGKGATFRFTLQSDHSIPN